MADKKLEKDNIDAAICYFGDITTINYVCTLCNTQTPTHTYRYADRHAAFTYIYISVYLGGYNKGR